MGQSLFHSIATQRMSESLIVQINDVTLSGLELISYLFVSPRFIYSCVRFNDNIM